jgi:hypothetical protein
MTQAFTALRTALAHAEHALAVLEQEPRCDTAFAVHVAGLAFQVTYARAELERAEEFTGRMHAETPEALDMVFPAGTVVACPGCGEGLYRTTTRVTAGDLLYDDGTLLMPLTIRFRHATRGHRWTALCVVDGYCETTGCIPCSNAGGNLMNEEEQSIVVDSLAAPFGENSMEAWLHRLLDERRCMDCKATIEEFDGAMVFRGQLPQIDLEGHLCPRCWGWREVLREGRHAQREGT